jgi:hypothetical protein
MSLPDRKFRSVVFPDPEGPRIAVNVPERIKPDCFCNIILVSVLVLALIKA